MNEQLNINTIPVSTHTFIAHTNLDNLDLEEIFNEAEINDFLVHVLYKKDEKGFRKKRKAKVCKKNFLNCISFTFIKNNKKINIKVFRNGTIQLTGCKNFDHCKTGIILFWNLIKSINCGKHFNCLELYLVSVMRNVNFNIGFLIDREKLGKYIIEKSSDYKISPVMGGFIGMQFLVELKSIDDMPVYKFKINQAGDMIEEDYILYKDFIKIINVNNKISKRYINIAIFQTGRILISGIHEKYQNPLIQWFLNLVEEVKEDIKTKTNPIFTLKNYLKPSN